MSNRTVNMGKVVKGFTADPEVAGIIRTGSGKAMSIVYTDGRVLPFVAGGAGEGGGQGGDGGQNNAGNNAAQGGGQPQKVEFSPEQQAKIQELLNKTYQDAIAKVAAAKDYVPASEVERLKAEIATLKGNGGQNNAGGNNGGNGGGQGGQAAQNEEVQRVIQQIRTEYDGKINTLTQELTRRNEDSKRASILSAVAGHNVVNANEVVQLLWNDIRMDEHGNLTAQGEGGAARINKQGLPMNVNEYIADWLASHPHHLRSSGTPGAGSAGASGLPGAGQKYDLSVPGTWTKLPKEEKDRLLKEGISLTGQSGQVFKIKRVGNPYQKP